MALSGTLTGTCDNTSYTLTCEWSATQSVANNTSSITAKVYLKAPSGWSTQSSNWSCVINGTTVTTGKSATVGSTAVLLGQRTWTVNHASDGTCSVTISFSYSNGLSAAGTYTTKKGSGSKSVTLNQIARTSSFTLSNSSLDMGTSQTVTISRASTSFTHKVEYTFGSSTTTVSSNATTSVSFTPPVSLASQIPNATSSTCTVKVTTYNGSTSIGTASKTFTLKVPASVKPSVTIGATYNNTLSGLSVAGKSTVTIKPTGTGSYSSTIKSYSYSGAGLSGTGSSKTTGTLSAGSYTVTVTVTDSRGRTGSANVSFTVYAYSAPTCSVSAFRANSDGTANPSGTYVRLKLNWSVSNPNNASTNKRTYTVDWKRSTDSVWSNYRTDTLSAYSGSSNDWNAGGDWLNTVTYQIRFTVTDSFGSASSSCTVSTISALLNIEKGGVGIGKIYESGALDVGGVINASGYFNSSGNGKNIKMGTGTSDVYIYNSASNRYLQLKDNGELTYNDWTVWHNGNGSSSGNRWGVNVTVDSNGVMEVGKHIDFHESDGDTSDYKVRLSSENGWLTTNKMDIASSEFGGLCVTRQNSTNGAAIAFYNSNGYLGYIGMWGSANGGLYRYSADTKNQYRILDSNGSQTITGTIHTGGYTDSYQGITMRRYNSGTGNYMGKMGLSLIGTSERAVTIEVGAISNTSNDTFSVDRRYSFGYNYFLVHTDNTVSLGSSNYRFKAVNATNGTIQTSDGRYKYILEDVNSETCYELIKDMNLYGYSTLNKRIDEYTSIAEISDELQQSSNEDMNLHMGFVAQEIEGNELAKYILIKDNLEDEDGKPTGEYIYGIDNYGYTTAVHSALKYEIELRDKQIENLQNKCEVLEEKVEHLENLILKGE